MAPIRVVHISTVGMGLRYLLLNQMTAIREHGYSVSAISAPTPDIRPVIEAGIEYLPVPLTRRFSLWLDLLNLFRLVRVLRRERFTIVHTHTPKAALLGQYAALIARTPIRVHTIHGLYLPHGTSAWKRRLFVWMERATMRFSHLNLSQNPEDIPVAVEEGIAAPSRIALLGNGIDITRFDPGRYPAERRRVLRATLALEGRHRVVGMVARFVAEKGYRELLEAAKALAETVPDARFVLIGPVEHEKADALSPELIAEMGLSATVQFLGHRTDVADLYAVMDVLALPSYREGFPRAPMEAAAMGIPSVVTDIRGCRQTVDDGVTGYLVPVRDASALAGRLAELLTHEERRTQFGRAARLKAETEFDERVVFGRVLAAYRELLRQHGLDAPAGESGSVS